jgi:hypothetical protein
MNIFLPISRFSRGMRKLKTVTLHLLVCFLQTEKKTVECCNMFDITMEKSRGKGWV